MHPRGTVSDQPGCWKGSWHRAFSGAHSALGRFKWYQHCLEEASMLLGSAAVASPPCPGTQQIQEAVSLQGRGCRAGAGAGAANT